MFKKKIILNKDFDKSSFFLLTFSCGKQNYQSDGKKVPMCTKTMIATSSRHKENHHIFSK